MDAEARPFFLVAEDNMNDVLLLKYALKQAEFPGTVHHVVDGKEAQEYLAGEGSYGDRNQFPYPDLILCDLNMPRMTGLEFLAWVKTQPVLKRIPFVLFTSSDDDEDVARAYDDHVNSYVVKPGKPSSLGPLMKTLTSYWLDQNVSSRTQVPSAPA